MSDRAGRNKKALLIIDMLNDFVDPKGALYCGDSSRKIIPVIQEKIQEHRGQDHLIIYLKDSHSPDDKEFELFPRHGVAGTWGSEIIPELAPEPGDLVIPKTRYSGFYQTDLEQILKEHRVTEVVVTGVCTSICVSDTVGGLRNRDYAVTVVKEGVADFNPRFHRFSLERMQKIYGAKLE